MGEIEKATVASHLEASSLLKRGRADVFAQRERTRRRKVLRLFVIIAVFDAYLWYRYATNNPIRLPSLPDDWVVFLPPSSWCSRSC